MKPKNTLFTVILFFFLFVTSFAQQKTNDEILSGFDDYINKTMADWKVQGCAIAIVKNGSIIYSKGYGFRDVKNNLPVTVNTQFAIGSCTKAFTSAAVYILSDRGKLELDKPVITYMPTFKMFDDYVTMNMTPRDLMCHRSGLPRHDLVWYGADLTRQEIFYDLRYLEPSKPFRTTFQYQNGMFLAAGVLVEQVSGASWENFVKENILSPLDMKATNFSINDMQSSTDYSKPYRESKDVVKEIPFRNIDAMGPAGSINSNVTEMSNWVIMQLNSGTYNGKEIISSGAVSDMHSPQIMTPGGLNKDVYLQSYGLGWAICSYKGHYRVEHGGNIDGFSASVCLFPLDSIGIVILTNMDGTQYPSVARNNAADRFLGVEVTDWSAKLLGDRGKADKNKDEDKSAEDKDRVKDTEPSHKLSDYSGSYTHPAYGKIQISLQDGTLHLSYHSFESKLSHYHYDVFSADAEDIEGLKINFVTDSKGNISKLTSPLEPTMKEIEFTKAAEVKDINYSIVTGEYVMDQMMASVSLKGTSVLTLTIPGQPTYELVSTGGYAFDIKGLNGYSVSFNIDGQKASEIVFHQPNGVFTAKRK